MTDQCRQEFEKWIAIKRTRWLFYDIWQAAWTAREETLFPVFDTLERLYDSGHYVKKQDGMWHLFNKDGEGIACGQTFRALCVNVVLEGL